MRFLFILDEIAGLHLEGDSSYALMLEAAGRGHELWTTTIADLGLEHEDAVAVARPTGVRPAETPAEAFSLEAPSTVPLDAFDAVFMRKDPPVDMDYLQTTWLLDRARGKTVLVNDPRGLRELNEHLTILEFPDLIAPTIVTRSPARLREFLEEQGGAIVVKPVEGFAGRGVFLVRSGDPNTSSMFETAVQDGLAWTMAQRYLPEATEGDKRILLVEGEPIGAVLRVPPPGEARDNLHVGARAVATEITEEERRILRAVGPYLVAHGQIFAGVDVIGGRLTEINITSPTGLRHLDAVQGGTSAAPVLDAVEKRVTSPQAERL